MNKKIIISEAQYEKLKFFILETAFDVLAKNTIKDNDVIKITANNEVLSFKVIDNLSGQIYMQNIDKGKEYFDKLVFLSLTSFNDNKLDLRVANDAQRQEKPLNSSNWSKLTLKNVEKIDVFRGDKLIDSTSEKQQPSDDKKDDNKNIDDEGLDNVNDMIRLVLDNLKTGNGLTIIMSNNEKIKLCCQSASNGVFILELIGETTLEAVSKFDSITIKIIPVDDEDAETDLLTANKELWSSTDNGKTVNVIIDGRSGDDTEKVKITGISDFNIEQSCTSEEDKEEDNKEDEEEEEYDAEKVLQLVLSDPNLKAAFYKQPTFWQAFKAELTGKEAKGKGILPTLDLINKYIDKKVSDKLGGDFKKNASVSFMPMETISIPFTNKKGGREYFELKDGVKYEGEFAVVAKRFSYDDIESRDYQILENTAKGFRIIVKEKTDTPNVFLCNVEKLYSVKNEPKRAKEEDVEIRLLDSNGYKADKEEKK
jgi:hypothetical protein